MLEFEKEGEPCRKVLATKSYLHPSQFAPRRRKRNSSEAGSICRS